MSKFKNQLQYLLDDCIQYKKEAPNDNEHYSAIENVIQALDTAVKKMPDDVSEIETLATKLKSLLDYEDLTDGKYEQWANNLDAFLAHKKHQELLDKVRAIKKEEVERFVVLYNELTKADRKQYKALAKKLKNYSKMFASANQWQKNVTQFLELDEERKALAVEYKDLKINNSDDDIILITPKKTIEINALLVKFNTFKVKIEALPNFFGKIKNGFIKPFCFNHIEQLTNALQRTTKILEDPSIQPPPHEDHSYTLKTITGKLFDQPKNNTKNEPLIAENDALQGSLGDCYLIASLMGLARKKPDVIRNAIKEIKQGGKVTYEVTLYFLDGNDKKKLVSQKIKIDNQFTVKSDGSSAYAAKGDQGELWVLVIEKAMAKALGGYKALAGGHTDWALRMLSGKFPTSNNMDQGNSKTTPPRKGTSKEDIINILKNNKGKLITVAIQSSPKEVSGLFKIEDVEGVSTESHYISFGKYSIYCKHAYLIDSIDYAKLDTAGDKDPVITLKNPHNTTVATLKSPKVSPLLLKHCASKIVVL